LHSSPLKRRHGDLSQRRSGKEMPMSDPQFRSDQYEYRVAWSPEDDEFVARVTEFPSMSAFGGTREEALREIRIVVDAVLHDMAADRESPPEPLSLRHYSGKFALRMPPSLHKQLAAEAGRMGKSINALIVDLLQDGAAQH
jgi:predicted HicB family RNase H-like nuclease